MAEITLTINLPGVTAEELSAFFSPLLSSKGGVALSSGGPATPLHRKDQDPDGLITLKQAVSECALSYYMLRERVVDGDEIPYVRKSAARKSPVLIYRRDLWRLLSASGEMVGNKPAGGRPRSTVTGADVALGA